MNTFKETIKMIENLKITKEEKEELLYQLEQNYLDGFNDGLIFKKNTNEEVYKVTIGDWSNDGHSQKENVYFVSNLNKEEIVEAYKKTCKEIKLQLHGKNEDLIMGEEWKYLFDRRPKITEEAKQILKEKNYPFEKHWDEKHFSYTDVFEMFMWFVGYSSEKKLKYSVLEKEAICINGYWNNLFNENIGYGIF